MLDSDSLLRGSGPRDHVFVYFTDHGATGLLAFPNDDVSVPNKRVESRAAWANWDGDQSRGGAVNPRWGLLTSLQGGVWGTHLAA